MTLENRRPRSGDDAASQDHARRRRAASRRTPSVERLEGRQLLATAGPTSQTIHTSAGAAYTLAVEGPGAVRSRTLGRNTVAITLLGTTEESRVTLTQNLTRRQFANSALQIRRIDVRSGALGSFEAGSTADLIGPITPLSGEVNALQFRGLGRNARIDVGGSLESLAITGDVNLQDGRVRIARGSGVSIGGMATLSGGRFDVNSPIQVGGDLTVNGSQVETSGLDVGGSLNVLNAGRVHFAGDLTDTFNVGANVLLLDNGQVVVDRDLRGAVNVGGNFMGLRGGNLQVGRDLTGGLTVEGDLVLATGAAVDVGRRLASLRVDGDLNTSQNGAITVDGDLSELVVSGVAVGDETNDIVVGLSLGNLRVLGGGPNQSGIRSLDVNVSKNIEGLDVPHGIFFSRITAGILIDGEGDTTIEGANVGPDGPIAVLDSTITAGVQIRNLTIAGDVVSTRPRDPNGRPTRIVAGVDRAGNYTIGGNIDNFQITGSLIDAVVAASVAPNGGNGTVTTVFSNAPGDGGRNTYDAPGGTQRIGQFGAFVEVENFTAPPYDPTEDPTIDDLVLPGSINASFAPADRPALPAPDPETPIGLPTKSTVLGGVISTPHGDEADHAGFFAADTSGVFVGTLPR